MQNVKGTTPIEAGWKVSRVLAEHPELVSEFIRLSPAFTMLRNSIARKVQSRLVTVAEAARIANLDPERLVRQLNTAIGITTTEEGAGGIEDSARDARTNPERPPWLDTAPVDLTVDVRPMQAQGQEPFSVIVQAARKIEQGRAFRLINTFEPVPLYDVLARQGFVHWTSELEPDHWEILFFKTGVVGKPEASQPTKAAAMTQAWDEPTQTLTIDVSELVPPEPMIRILGALEELPAGATLLVHHARRPIFLYPRLDELGYRHETRELAPDRVEVLIEKTAG
ncbi:MAG TPA: DUF2249 domain-containing protein [Thermomicrobiaceae bacterium]|nr:DUF2249 domain-containing protein [Thermomicrobiaceae bacterium]